ncbi:MAG: MarR family winged helix-turn-helix transcriptional regulator [Solirubrobacteraceae bacterium]
MSETDGDGREQVPRLSYIVGRLDRAVRHELDHRLQPFGLSWPQYTALSVLRHTAGLSNAQLARRSYVTPQSMIEVISALESAGYVERAPSASHRRVLETQLTARGLAELEACDRAVDEMEREMLAGIAESERAALSSSLISCVRALHAGFARRGSDSAEPTARAQRS